MVSVLEKAIELLGWAFFACYFYQMAYIAVSLFRKPRVHKAKVQHHFGVLISARNEELVIGQLIRSIRQQNYPKELIDIFVVADNCTDHTAQVAREAGAIVYERFNTELVGKGYALNELLHHIDQDYTLEHCEGYFVFDADNVLDENYVAHMNDTFDQGYRAITSYRNSKNYDSNWISAGYALWFLREARYLNQARMILGTSCFVSGTGFLVHTDIFRKNGGWKHHLLTEDIEFSTDTILSGKVIGYNKDAVLYDEQPTTFRDSWNQRLRWSKGFYQVFFRYGGRLVKKVGQGCFSAYDMLMTLAPGMLVSAVLLPLGLLMILVGVTGDVYTVREMQPLISRVGMYVIQSYGMLFAMGALTVLTEWKHIHCKNYKKILYLFTFPLFMYTYLPISVVALVRKIEWKPIRHNVVRDVRDIRMSN